MKVKKLFGAIQKVHDQDDGTIIVEGVASTQDQDSDGETITSDAIKSAIPDYMKFGAVREMHQAKAAGTALNIDVADTGITTIKAHIVDGEAIKKVKSGVYKGFSVGGSVTKRDDLNKTIITGINLIEVSLVDRPANPNAVITCYKADGIEPEAEQTQEADGETLQKSMYSLRTFASLLQEVLWIIGEEKTESEWKGENSPFPAQLKDWLEAGAEIFSAMAQSEIDCLVEHANQIAKAKKTDDLQKAGSKFSKTTKAQLLKIFQALPDRGELMIIGCDIGDVGDTSQPDDTAKADKPDDLSKVNQDLDLTKTALNKMTQERDDLKKRVSELEAQPEETKAVVKDLSKAEDVANTKQDEVAPILDSRGDLNEIATMIKAAQARRI